MHKPLAGYIFPVGELERVGYRAQSSRQPRCQRHSHRAAMALERNLRPAKPRRQDVPFDCRLEVITVSRNEPIWISRGLNEFRRHRIARNPELHRVGGCPRFC